MVINVVRSVPIPLQLQHRLNLAVLATNNSTYACSHGLTEVCTSTQRRLTYRHLDFRRFLETAKVLTSSRHPQNPVGVVHFFQGVGCQFCDDRGSNQGPVRVRITAIPLRGSHKDVAPLHCRHDSTSQSG